MMTFLHINDNNLLLQQGASLQRSKGYVWFNGEDLVFDAGALECCRLNPQQINNRYWQQCDQSSIARNDAGMRHAADLVWQHLKLFHERGVSDAALVVPSHYQSSNLQLLLGICKASELKATALINKAVFATHEHIKADGKYAHIDVQVHQTVVSHLIASNGVVKLGDVEVIQDVGIHLIEEALLKRLQSNFINSNRFDPLHDAAYEQQLFDQLPMLAKQVIDQGKASVTVTGDGHVHNANIEASEFNEVLLPFLERLSRVKADQVFIDFNAAFEHATPAMIQTSQLVHLSSQELPDYGLVEIQQGDASLIYQTELPYQVVGNTASASTAQAKQSVANASGDISDDKAHVSGSKGLHLLLSGKAWPIGRAEVLIADGQLQIKNADKGNAASLIESGKLFIVGDEQRKKAKANDRFASNLADGVITVIEVVEA